MIRMALHGGRWRPEAVCDHCQEPITDPRAGNVEWVATAPEALHFVHKSCSRAFRTRVRPELAGKDGCWSSLRAFCAWQRGCRAPRYGGSRDEG